MKIGDYLRDKATILLIHIAGLFFLLFFLRLESNSYAVLCIIAVVWIVVLCVWLTVDFTKQKHKFGTLFSQLEKLEKPYLIAEVMESAPCLVDRLYREAMRISNRSVIEKIHELELSGRDYKEYIEGWVHEIKLPLTAAKLMCENEPTENNRRLLMQLDRIDKHVEQVLYYARMEHAYQDYLIHEVNLREVVLAAISANKMYFIQQKIQIHMELEDEGDTKVFTDEKWIEFLLSQIFANAIKYCREENPIVRIYAKRGENKLSLIVEDNGVGIAKEDLGRIFDKGFTGKNGRSGKKSTGIGLYLCKGLCDKLGIGIACQSEDGEYTQMILTFPHSDYIYSDLS